MQRWSRKLLAVVAAIAAIAALTGSVTSAPAAAGFTLPDVGVVRLHMANDGRYVRFDAANGSGGFTTGTPSPITVSSCGATVTGPLSVAPTPAPNTGKLGLVDNGLGVQVKGEGNGTPCGRVDGLTQALTLQLAAPLASKELDFAELDVEVKFGGTVRAELYLGAQLVRVELLPTTGISDSGPDSADGDNYRWRLPAVGNSAIFNKIVLKVDASTPGGAFSLAGGDDGTAPQVGGLGSTLGTRDSLFHVTDIDGILDCGDTAARGTTSTPQALLNRLPNGLGGCVPIPYILRTGFEGDDQLVELQKDLGTQAALQPAFALSVTWTPEPAEYPVARATQIDYGTGPQTMVWCNGTSSAPIVPAGQSWCITAQSVDLVGTGLVQVKESYYGSGDPRWIR